MGNVIDRLRYGAVVDFIHAHLGDWSWYVFNVADAAIVCGVAALILEGQLRRRPRQPDAVTRHSPGVTRAGRRRRHDERFLVVGLARPALTGASVMIHAFMAVDRGQSPPWPAMAHAANRRSARSAHMEICAPAPARRTVIPRKFREQTMASTNWTSGMVTAGGTELHVTRGGEGRPSWCFIGHGPLIGCRFTKPWPSRMR